MIEPKHMYASKAFLSSETMKSKFLIEMDNREKNIIEQEETDLRKSSGIFAATIWGITAFFASSFWTFSRPSFETISTETRAKSRMQLRATISTRPHRRDILVSTIFGVTLGFALGRKGYLINYRKQEDISLERCNRLEEKTRNISKQILSIKKEEASEELKEEIEQLEKALTYFSNRVLWYKAELRAKGAHILFQSNQYRS